MLAGGSSRRKILGVLGEGKPLSSREVIRLMGLSDAAVYNCLRRCWKNGMVLRTKEPIYESERVFKGRAGVSRTTRPYHLYVLKPDGRNSLHLHGQEFVEYDKEYLDARGGGEKSKAQMVLDFLKENSSEAWFSTQVAEALEDKGVKTSDVMANVRRYEKKGLVYVRGYQVEEKQTPFREGYLMTWINPAESREEALEAPIQRTNKALANRNSTSPVIERVHRLRDVIISQTKLRRLVGFPYLQNKLSCSKYKTEHAIERALQLYPDLKGVKLFNAYRYYHHDSLAEEDLNAAVEMKKNYLRIVKGRANRIGHNWEAVVE